MSARAAVTLRYWAAARAATGVAEESCQAATVAEALDEAGRRHGDRLLRVLPGCAVLVGSVRAHPHTVLHDGDVVELLPPFAGGSA